MLIEFANITLSRHSYFFVASICFLYWHCCVTPLCRIPLFILNSRVADCTVFVPWCLRGKKMISHKATESLKIKNRIFVPSGQKNK